MADRAEEISTLFVCGTLRPGLTPPALTPVVQKLRCLGPASVTGRLYDLGEYPGAQLTTNSNELVVGAVLELPDQALLKTLDDYEGIDQKDIEGSLFVRRKCQAK